MNTHPYGIGTMLRWFVRFKLNPEKRKDIFLATKFGITPEGPRGDPEYLRQCLDKSLSLLGVEYVDLYYVHRFVATLVHLAAPLIED